MCDYLVLGSTSIVDRLGTSYSLNLLQNRLYISLLIKLKDLDKGVMELDFPTAHSRCELSEDAPYECYIWSFFEYHSF